MRDVNEMVAAMVASDLDLKWDDELRALHWATIHLPPPQHVTKASRAKDDLWHRVKNAGHRPLTRDEQRLDRRYRAVADQYVKDAVRAYHNRH